jgi:hypothetical protein
MKQKFHCKVAIIYLHKSMANVQQCNKMANGPAMRTRWRTVSNVVQDGERPRNSLELIGYYWLKQKTCLAN